MSKYQEGLDETKNWLKSHSRLEIEDILAKSGLSEKKAKRYYVAMHCMD